MTRHIAAEPFQPVGENKLREHVRQYLDAWRSGDSKRIADAVRHLNQVGYSKKARQAEIERQAVGDVDLETALVRLREKIKANLQSQKVVIKDRRWNLGVSRAEIARANSKWWQNLS